jgi:hypothetical protein
MAMIRKTFLIAGVIWRLGLTITEPEFGVSWEVHIGSDHAHRTGTPVKQIAQALDLPWEVVKQVDLEG